ncbi:MAG: hypothetical protein CVV04_05800 [Firmicutes bacterium HGW-Firmicutes-9]|jgi:hypothetical protein|nr:MAG: hypothetical protein CVV04_05800 [Firmicutes bacterium HGW-Firmicutes-9]
MKRLRKTLGNFDDPEILSLTRLAETQSKRTLCIWSIQFAQEHLLPIYERSFPDDPRPCNALINSRGWLEGHVKYIDAKETNNGTHNAATEAVGNPAAQAAARAIAHASLTIHVSAHCMGIAFYGAAAIAYNKLGLNATLEEYLFVARQVWVDLETELRNIAVECDPNPANLNWEFWSSRI